VDKLILYKKKLVKEDISDIDSDLTYKEISSNKDRLKYVKTFISGFNKERRTFFLYYLNSFDSQYKMYLIQQGNQVIGCFALRPKGKGVVYLYDFTILKQYRGNGIGRKALKLVYKESFELNKLKLHLYLKKGNDIALNLYLSEGFIKYSNKKK
jgi:ribosomal protein S18 acetylase RimI-like enzyme